MKKLAVSVLLFFTVAIFAATVIPSSAQTLTTLHNFTGPEGADPYYAPLVLGRDGNYYGTTYLGGANSSGAVFKITPERHRDKPVLQLLLADFVRGWLRPLCRLVTMGNDGNFYGTTAYGGNPPSMTQAWFSKSPLAAPTPSCTSSASRPTAQMASVRLTPLTLASDGNFYGTTLWRGSNNFAEPLPHHAER